MDTAAAPVMRWLLPGVSSAVTVPSRVPTCLCTAQNTGINFDAYEDIPVETSGKDVPPPVNSFEELQLPQCMLENIKRCKFTKPTPVQKYSMPIGLAGRDMMACAQTGSGKTAAFCFPIIASMLMKGYQPSAARNSRKALPGALVLAPTRELTSQIYDEARKFTYMTGLRPVVIYGGAPAPNQVPLPLAEHTAATHVASCTNDAGACIPGRRYYFAVSRADVPAVTGPRSCATWSAAATSWWPRPAA